MRIVIVFLIAALLGLFVTASVVHFSYPAALAPDVILVLVVALSLYYHNPLGVFGAFLLGLLADFASARYLGPNAAGCVLAFVFVGLIANRVYADKVLAVFIITLLCSIVKTATELGLLAFTLPRFHLPEGLLRTMIGEALLTASIAPFVMRLLRRRVATTNTGTSSRLHPAAALRLSSSGN